ncbi:hypothetical protein [Paenibacillus lignilyticus]|uniref:Uncharacterized protein n=1 Tax=Paenibacillus lignilyticus TaxID=1172615 RepID=A0ABS5C712_9BACL|nr:hypothetical protein [Paenibacillus lignilyticus]MBP3961437.1 hypothetical protein [Paenibacillus lignilyticus]
MSLQEDVISIDYLKRTLRFYENIDIASQLMGPTDDAPYTSLIIRFTEIGEREATIDLEMSFLPGLQELNQEGVYLFQSFAVLAPQTSKEHEDELLKAISILNIQLPLGTFGVFPDGGALYLKQTAMLSREGLVSGHAVKLLDQQNGVLLHQLHQFTDYLLDVSAGKRKAESTPL